MATRPRQATVFPGSARVTREGGLRLAAGSHQLVFPDLPASVVESSLRLTVDGPRGPSLYGFSLRSDYRPEVAEKRARLLKARLQDRMEAWKAEMELLQSLGNEVRE